MAKSDVNVEVCPGTLAEGFYTYSPFCLRNVFQGRQVSHILPYNKPTQDEEVESLFIENRKRISISGVQEKLSFILDKNKLRVTKEGEQGTYILKPIPRDLMKVDQVPANEHLTMQIADQLYGIRTALNAMIFFKDGTPAYITKRFDIKQEGGKWSVEDFASLADKTIDTSGENYKYNYSYEELGLLIYKYLPTARIEMEKYFSLILFNYLFSNGDAHLKNFSIIETAFGDYILSPAYDLVNTRLHVQDTDFALEKGLFADDFKSLYFKNRNHPGKEDFIEFGKRIRLPLGSVEKIIGSFLEKKPLLEPIVQRSFLDEKSKKSYLLHYQTKRNFLLEK